MNRTDLLGAAAVYELAQGLVLCHEFRPAINSTKPKDQTYRMVRVVPTDVPHRDPTSGLSVPTSRG